MSSAPQVNAIYFSLSASLFEIFVPHLPFVISLPRDLEFLYLKIYKYETGHTKKVYIAECG